MWPNNSTNREQPAAFSDLRYTPSNTTIQFKRRITTNDKAYVPLHLSMTHAHEPANQRSSSKKVSSAPHHFSAGLDSKVVGSWSGGLRPSAWGPPPPAKPRSGFSKTSGLDSAPTRARSQPATPAKEPAAAVPRPSSADAARSSTANGPQQKPATSASANGTSGWSTTASSLSSTAVSRRDDPQVPTDAEPRKLLARPPSGRRLVDDDTF